MNKLLYYISYIWNYLILNLIKAEYAGFPTIVGFIGIKGFKGKIYFGKNVLINSNKWSNPVGLSSSTYLCVNQNAVIEIGNNVGISNALLYAREKITIEDDVIIGGGCQILDNDFHCLDYAIRRTHLDQENVVSAKIVIRKGVFIGTGSIVLKGVEIGEQSIIAAGSVVTKNIPSFEIWGGNPAKFIRGISNPSIKPDSL
ncbi:acyltransferase [Mucilaginibacter sp. 22184]|uniref:acyltransferase n=1 Tax=Mucilaginibacter sp. 22184 TaxID=3453887 RepID=UPI003F858E3A